MIGALTVLLLFQLIGEVAVQATGIPVPGPVIGMLLLFIALRWRTSLPDTLRTTAENLLAHLSLLFIPAGVGIIQHGALLASEWPALLAAIVLGTLITVAVTGLAMYWIMRLQRRVSEHG